MILMADVVPHPMCERLIYVLTIYYDLVNNSISEQVPG